MLKLTTTLALSALALPLASGATLGSTTTEHMTTELGESEQMRTAHTSIAAGFEQLETLMVLGLPTERSIDELRNEIDDLPSSAELRARMASLFDDLAEQARTSFVEAADLALVREEFVDGRVDRYLDVLRRRAVASELSPEVVQELASRWIARAEAFESAPDPAAYRSRVSAILERARATAIETLEQLRASRTALLRAQLSSTVRRLRFQRGLEMITEGEFESRLASAAARIRRAASAL